MFGFDPQRSIARLGESGEKPSPPTYGSSIAIGSIGFCIISLLVFAIWAFAGKTLSKSIGEGGFYAVCAFAFVGLSGMLFDRLVIGRTLGRFYALFTTAFLSYSIVWCVVWFLCRRPSSEWYGFLTGPRTAGVEGALLGAIAMASVFCIGFRNWKPFGVICLILFLGNAVGYFLGDAAFTWLLSENAAESLSLTKANRVLLAKLSWGLFYGLGFGFGIADALHRLQSPVRQYLVNATRPPAPLEN
jgi:hypothetical protein